MSEMRDDDREYCPPTLTRDEAARQMPDERVYWVVSTAIGRELSEAQCERLREAWLTALYGPPVETPTPIPGHHKVNYGSAIWETPTPDGAKTCETCKWVFRSRSGTGRTGCDHDALVGSGVGWLPPDFGCTFHERTTLDVEG